MQITFRNPTKPNLDINFAVDKLTHRLHGKAENDALDNFVHDHCKLRYHDFEAVLGVLAGIPCCSKEAAALDCCLVATQLLRPWMRCVADVTVSGRDGGKRIALFGELDRERQPGFISQRLKMWEFFQSLTFPDRVAKAYKDKLDAL